MRSRRATRGSTTWRFELAHRVRELRRLRVAVHAARAEGEQVVPEECAGILDGHRDVVARGLELDPDETHQGRRPVEFGTKPRLDELDTALVGGDGVGAQVHVAVLRAYGAG